MSKGSVRRPESAPGKYAAGWDEIFGQRTRRKAVDALRRLDEELAQPTRPGTRQGKVTKCCKPRPDATQRQDSYPSWVCADCATKAGGKHRRADGISTWHTGDCEVCGITQWVTQPRDYGYPRFQK